MLGSPTKGGFRHEPADLDGTPGRNVRCEACGMRARHSQTAAL